MNDLVDLIRRFQAVRLPTARQIQGGAGAENVSCGDAVAVRVDRSAGGTIACVTGASGCALLRGSAAVMREVLSGRCREEAAGIVAAVLAVLDDRVGGPAREERNTAVQSHTPLPAEVETLLAVRSSPGRVRCVRLPWEAAREALSPPPTVETAIGHTQSE